MVWLNCVNCSTSVDDDGFCLILKGLSKGSSIGKGTETDGMIEGIVAVVLPHRPNDLLGLKVGGH